MMTDFAKPLTSEELGRRRSELEDHRESLDGEPCPPERCSEFDCYDAERFLATIDSLEARIAWALSDEGVEAALGAWLGNFENVAGAEDREYMRAAVRAALTQEPAHE